MLRTETHPAIGTNICPEFPHLIRTSRMLWLLRKTSPKYRRTGIGSSSSVHFRSRSKPGLGSVAKWSSH